MLVMHTTSFNPLSNLIIHETDFTYEKNNFSLIDCAVAIVIVQ